MPAQRLAKRSSKRTQVDFKAYSVEHNPTKLSPNRLRFVEEYLVDLDGKNAAIRAGFAPANAAIQANQLLNNPLVRSEVDRRLEARAKRVGVKAERVIQELASMGFANIINYLEFDKKGPKYNLSKLTAEEGAAIAELVIDEDRRKVLRLKLNNKTTALELLGKHLGMFKDNVVIMGPDGGPVKVIHEVRRKLIAEDGAMRDITPKKKG